MTPSYLHQTQGRIRIRSQFIQQHPEEIAAQIQQLKELPGITSIFHRRHSGSVTILFDHQTVKENDIILHAHSYNWINPDKKPDTISQLIQNNTQKLLKYALLGTVKRSLGGSAAMILAATLKRI